MPRVPFRQRDIERAIRAAQAMGYAAPAVEILPDGTIRLFTVAPGTKTPESELDAELGALIDAMGEPENALNGRRSPILHHPRAPHRAIR